MLTTSCTNVWGRMCRSLGRLVIAIDFADGATMTSALVNA